MPTSGVVIEIFVNKISFNQMRISRINDLSVYPGSDSWQHFRSSDNQLWSFGACLSRAEVATLHDSAAFYRLSVKKISTKIVEICSSTRDAHTAWRSALEWFSRSVLIGEDFPFFKLKPIFVQVSEIIFNFM